MLQIVALGVLIICWIAWILAFVIARRRVGVRKKVVSAPISKWGVALQIVGFMVIGARLHSRLLQPPQALENTLFVASMILGPLSCALAWVAVRHLGKQWRIEAALSEDHELVQTGPYRWVRHPIYASMLGMLLAFGFVLDWWPMMIVGLIFFLIGLEIRIRAEDRLLAERFGETFAGYRSRVPAYIPFVR